MHTQLYMIDLLSKHITKLNDPVRIGTYMLTLLKAIMAMIDGSAILCQLYCMGMHLACVACKALDYL